MSIATNWKVEFQNVAGHTVHVASGNESVMTTDIKTPETFLFKGLLNMEEHDLATADFGCDVEPVSEHWKKAVIDAQVFGITGVEINKDDVDQATIDSARQMVANGVSRPPAPDIAGDVFG